MRIFLWSVLAFLVLISFAWFAEKFCMCHDLLKVTSFHWTINIFCVILYLLTSNISNPKSWHFLSVYSSRFFYPWVFWRQMGSRIHEFLFYKDLQFHISLKNTKAKLTLELKSCTPAEDLSCSRVNLGKIGSLSC